MRLQGHRDLAMFYVGSVDILQIFKENAPADSIYHKVMNRYQQQVALRCMDNGCSHHTTVLNVECILLLQAKSGYFLLVTCFILVETIKVLFLSTTYCEMVVVNDGSQHIVVGNQRIERRP